MLTSTLSSLELAADCSHCVECILLCRVLCATAYRIVLCLVSTCVSVFLCFIPSITGALNFSFYKRKLAAGECETPCAEEAIIRDVACFQTKAIFINTTRKKQNARSTNKSRDCLIGTLELELDGRNL